MGWSRRSLATRPPRNAAASLSIRSSHIDPFGTVILPMLLAISHAPVFGWARPVPVNYARLRNPRRDMVLVALAGPGMNLLLALVGAVVLAATLSLSTGSEQLGDAA